VRLCAYTDRVYELCIYGIAIECLYILSGMHIKYFAKTLSAIIHARYKRRGKELYNHIENTVQYLLQMFNNILVQQKRKSIQLSYNSV
jgi:hypothetical protein